MVQKPIYDITPHSLLEYDGKIASIIWFAGCPLRCVYCHNHHMISAIGTMSENEAIEFLVSRRGWSDAVVLSGGECCMYGKIVGFCRKIKEIGFCVKVDTSGIYPKTAIELAKSGFVDKISLDFKAPQGMFEVVTGANAFNLFERTLKGLLNMNFDVDVRTTVYPEYIDENMLSGMAETLYSMGYRGRYAIQMARTEQGTAANLEKSRRGFNPSLVASKLPISFIGF